MDTAPKSQPPVPATAQHYPSRGAKFADLGVHLGGLAFAVIGGAVLFIFAAQAPSWGKLVAVAVYVASFIAMLSFSTAYNFSRASRQPLLRRLDHAGIFLMIAGTYTPFTVLGLTGAWAIVMTLLVWGLALLGALGKLFLPGLGKRLWVVLYLALGWLIVIALKPLAAGVPSASMILLAVGGVIYCLGVVFYLIRRMPFRRAVWHGHVISAAVVHYFAVLVGVVLVR